MPIAGRGSDVKKKKEPLDLTFLKSKGSFGVFSSIYVIYKCSKGQMSKGVILVSVTRSFVNFYFLNAVFLIKFKGPPD